MLAKSLAGYDTTMVDALGSLLSGQIKSSKRPEIAGLRQSAGRLSQVTSLSNMTAFRAPYPIISSIGLEPLEGHTKCYVADNQSIDYEWHPYEFGSWETPVRMFINTENVGSYLNGGAPVSHMQPGCSSGLDDIGFITATSMNTMNFWCTEVPGVSSVIARGLDVPYRELIAMTTAVHDTTFEDQYGMIPNPFFNSSSNNSVFSTGTLFLVGGHQGGRDLPLWPLLQPERHIDVIFINDNSDENDGDWWPTGVQLYNNFQKARKSGLTRMPTVPRPEELTTRQMNKRALTVFGCNDTEAITILYMPNRDISIGGNKTAFQVVWTQEEVNAMIVNGNQIAQGIGANNTGNEPFAACIACVFMKKLSTTPA